MAYLNHDIINNLYKDFIGARQLADKLNFFYDGKNTMQSNFPPYNIIESQPGHYTIQLAIAGYDKSDITIELKDNQLVITGERKKTEPETAKPNWIWCGIASRNFERKFMLEDNIVVGEADYQNGILSIDMERVVPDTQKPKLIAIR